MPYKKTIITVVDIRLEWDLSGEVPSQKVVRTEVPIHYYLPQEKAIKQFYSTQDWRIGVIKNIQEVTVYTWLEKLIRWIVSQLPNN